MLIHEKIKQSIALLREFGEECWITFTRESSVNGDPTLAFLSPVDLTWHSAFIISADGRTKAIVGQYDVKALEELGVYDEVTGYVTSFKEPFQDYLRKLSPSRICVNYSMESEICDGLTHGMYLTLSDLLAGTGMDKKPASAEKLVSGLRERKTSTEIAFIREAIGITETIFKSVSSFIKPGKTEREIAAFMSAETKRLGAVPSWAPATCPSVFSGPDTAGAHYTPTSRTVERGHVLNMDFGVKVNGYCSDMQRSFYILREGETEAPAPVRKGFAAIIDALESSRCAIKPGAQGIAVDTIARKVLENAGYETFPHALGHQVGRFAHDGTALLAPAWDKYGRKPFKPIEKGMVFAIEPRLTVPGHGVVTVEDMAMVTENGAEWLSHPQKELWLVQ